MIRLATASAPAICRKFQQFLAGGERVQPDIAQPPLHQQQHIGALAAVFGLDGGGQFVLPFFAQIFFHVVVFFQRRTRGQRFVHVRADFAELLQQRIEQPVAAEQAFLFAGGERAELLQPVVFRPDSIALPSPEKFRRRQRDKMVSKIR